MNEWHVVKPFVYARIWIRDVFLRCWAKNTSRKFVGSHHFETPTPRGVVINDLRTVPSTWNRT